MGNQINELREEAERKNEIINATVEKAATIIAEKETALQKLKCDNEFVIRQLNHSLGTALWVIEREIFMRRIFISFLSKSAVPKDISKFIIDNMDSMVSIMKSNEEILYRNVNQTETSDFFESKVAELSPHYLKLPITEEIALFSRFRETIFKLPSFIATEEAEYHDKT